LHNNSQSKLDERFRNFLGLTVGVETPEKQELWGRTMRALKRPQARAQLEELRAKTQRLGPGIWSIPAEADVLREMTERVARGLYWLHYGTRLPLEVGVQAAWLREFPDLERFVSDMARESVANGQFQYAYSRMDAHRSVSCWVFVFHGKIVTMAITDRDLTDQLVEDAE
jgi:hypothetical protein